MKIPAIDLSKFVSLLKSEGKAELSAAAPKPKLGEITARGAKPTSLSLFDEWNNIISVTEREIIPLLSKGCDSKALVAPAQKLLKSAGAITVMATEVLSFVPGPIGIVCSLINAIVCFSTGNIVGGLLELLGCIPGGKVAGKASSKLFPKIEKIMIEVVQSNKELAIIVETSTKHYREVTAFFARYAPRAKMTPRPKPAPPKTNTGYGYGVRTPRTPSALESSLSNKFPARNPGVEAQREIGKYTTFPNTYGNMPKTNLWPHLY